MSQPKITAEDAVQVAQRALEKCNEMESVLTELRAENDQLSQRVQELEAQQPDPSDYHDLDKDGRVGVVKRHLIRKAHDNNGRAQIGYSGVKWEAFDGEPSDGYCYDLMRKATNTAGFKTGTNGDGEQVLKVDMPQTPREERSKALSRVNNGG